jgi:hypothetical protein
MMMARRKLGRGAAVLIATAVLSGPVLVGEGQRAAAAPISSWQAKGAAWKTPGLPAVPSLSELVPEPGSSSVLAGVFCTSASNCWAVGYYRKGSGSAQVTLNLALHWNGQKWSRVSTPDPGGTAGGDGSDLTGVRCTSRKNCWAAGAYGAAGTAFGQALHWNGRRWSKVATPNPGGTPGSDLRVLVSVTCTVAANCWALGFDEKFGNGGITG